MKKLLRIHGNCNYYCWKKSQPAKEGSCSNRGMADFRYLSISPVRAACEHFEEIKK